MTEGYPEEETLSDSAHRLARMVAGGVPVVGATFVEYLNTAFPPQLQRRRDIWLSQLGERMERLEELGVVDFEELMQDEAFVSTVMQAAQAAIRSHQQEKLDALRNAVLNTAIGQAPEDSKREMLLGFVDSLTVMHLRIFGFLANPGLGTGASQLDGGVIVGNRVAVIGVIQKAFPELQGQEEFVQKFVGDLVQAQLIRSDVNARTRTGVMGVPNLTQLGGEFLRFITEPKGDE